MRVPSAPLLSSPWPLGTYHSPPWAAGWTAAGRALGTSPRLLFPRPVAPPALGWAAGSGAERSGVSIPTAFADPFSRLCFPHSPHPTPGMVRKGGCGYAANSPALTKEWETGLSPVKCRPNPGGRGARVEGGWKGEGRPAPGVTGTLGPLLSAHANVGSHCPVF